MTYYVKCKHAHCRNQLTWSEWHTAECASCWALRHRIETASPETLRAFLPELHTELDLLRAEVDQQRTRAEAAEAELAGARASEGSGGARTSDATILDIARSLDALAIAARDYARHLAVEIAKLVNEIAELRDKFDQQRTRAEAAEAELAEMRKAIADVDLTGADRRNELLDDMPMIEHPAPYRYEPKTSLPPVNDEDDGA